MTVFLYAAIMALFFLVLTYRVILARLKYKVGLGDGGEPVLQRAIRIHGNFIETVPLALLLILLVEQAEYAPGLVHGLGLILVAGRILHAVGLNMTAGTSLPRQAGTILTHLVFLIPAGLLGWAYICG